MRRETVTVWIWLVGIWLAAALVSLMVPVTTSSEPGGSQIILSGVAVIVLLVRSAAAATVRVLAWGRSEGPERSKGAKENDLL